MQPGWLVTVCLLPAALFAQAPALAQGTPVAIVDLQKVFAHHMRFQAALNDLRNDVKEFESNLADRQRQIAELRERLKSYKAGTPEYKQLEDQIAQLLASGQADGLVRRRELLTREARLYHDAYMEVVEQVADYARRHGIALVLIDHEEPITPDDRRSIGVTLERLVIYQQGLDITPAIIERLNRGVAPANVGGRPIIPQRR
jgi:Skp family chaperone for outer membrane proteins